MKFKNCILISLFCCFGIQLFANEIISYDHLIITSESLKQDKDEYSLNALKAHREAHGLSSIIISTDSIYAQYQGVDRPEKIRNFIRDAKEKWQIKYVLLAGDVNIVPARMLYARNIYMASDMYYGCLDNSFNDDGDARWGELNDGLDFEYDVYVGRASAQNATEMHNFVYKTLAYENSPLNASYHTKMLHMSQEASGIGNTAKWCDRYREKSDEITFEYYRATDAQADPITNNRMSNGNVGYYLGASHGYVAKLANITQGEAVKFKNADQFYFMTSIACLSGKFDQDCVAESFTTSTRTGGAFAGMFNSETAYPPYIVQYIYKLRDLHFVDKITRLGELRAKVATTYKYDDYLKSDNTAMARRYQAYQYNLFGDPATDLKTVLSTPVDLDYSEAIVKDGQVVDKSGNNNNAVLNGQVDSLLIFNRKAFKFANGAYLSVPHNPWNPMGNQLELSIAAWLSIDSLNSRVGLFVKGDQKHPFAMYLEETGHISLKMNEGSPANAWKTASWTSKVQLKEQGLYHLALVMEYKSLRAHLYIDGQKEESFVIPSAYLMGRAEEPLYIAKDPKQSNACFSGTLSDISMYSKSLSDLEVQQVMGAGKPFSLAHTSIVDAQSFEPISSYGSDQLSYSIDHSTTAQKPFAIAAELNTLEGFGGSVLYVLDDMKMVDNDADFSSFSEANALNTHLNQIGDHHLQLMLFSEKEAKGYLLDERSIDIKVWGSTHINPNSAMDNELNLSSALVMDVLKIEYTAHPQMADLAIYNTSGQQLYVETTQLNTVHQVDVSALKSGVYFINVKCEDRNYSFKFFKR